MLSFKKNGDWVKQVHFGNHENEGCLGLVNNGDSTLTYSGNQGSKAIVVEVDSNFSVISSTGYTGFDRLYLEGNNGKYLGVPYDISVSADAIYNVKRKGLNWCKKNFQSNTGFVISHANVGPISGKGLSVGFQLGSFSVRKFDMENGDVDCCESLKDRDASTLVAKVSVDEQDYDETPANAKILNHSTFLSDASLEGYYNCLTETQSIPDMVVCEGGCIVWNLDNPAAKDLTWDFGRFPNDTLWGNNHLICYDKNSSPFGFLMYFDGCPAFESFFIDIQPAKKIILESQICSGDSVAFRGKYFYNQGVFSDTVYMEDGCDSIFELQLTVHDPQIFYFSKDTIICTIDTSLILKSLLTSSNYYDIEKWTLYNRFGMGVELDSILFFSQLSSGTLVFEGINFKECTKHQIIFQIIKKTPPNLGISSSANLCNTSAVQLFEFLGGDPEANGIWTSSNHQVSQSGTVNFFGSEANSYLFYYKKVIRRL